MQIDITIDRHVHTHLCHHAVGTMEEYVLAALERGLRGMVFLEHLELGIDYFESTWLSEADFDAYWREGERLRLVYGHRIGIGLGVEVGYNPERLAELRSFLGRYPWERVGISHHFLKIDGRHHNLLSRKRENLAVFSRFGLKQVTDAYFQGLLAAVEELPGSALCHLDAVLRHHPDARFDEEHGAMINAILQALAAKGMALEVNTSGFPMRGEPYPGPAIFKRAAELGIRLEAGSDAHRPGDVGRFFDRLGALAHGGGREKR
ncbi:MAG: histidinol-phosphatase [Desulfobulbaceae bacterium]|nr:histidinol-phosphatase [Desulfobulbaceae bacterium]